MPRSWAAAAPPDQRVDVRLAAEMRHLNPDNIREAAHTTARHGLAAVEAALQAFADTSRRSGRPGPTPRVEPGVLSTPLPRRG
jgi:hypothetical protein